MIWSTSSVRQVTSTLSSGLLAHLAGGAQVGVGPLQGPPAAGDGVVGQAAVIPADVPGVGLTQGRLDGLQVGWGRKISSLQ